MERLALFVHGLGGSGKETWGSFPSLIQSDPELGRNYSVDLYEFPTRLFALPIIHKIPRIQVLARGLRTELEHR